MQNDDSAKELTRIWFDFFLDKIVIFIKLDELIGRLKCLSKELSGELIQ